MINIKTLVELFDLHQIENVIAALRFNPEKIVFVGFESVMTAGRRESIERFFAMRGLNIKIEYATVDRYNIQDIQEKLSLILDNNEDCCFDLTGGKELVLVAMGMISARRNVPMVQFNVRTGRLIRVQGSESLPEGEKSAMTIAECVALNGGEVVYNDPLEFHWKISEDFEKDIRVMWDICRENCSKWNKQANSLKAYEMSGETSGLNVTVSLNNMSSRGKSTIPDEKIMKKLCAAGLVRNYSQEKGILSFEYKNRQIKHCLSKAGNILELYAYTTIKKICESSPGYYDDADVGVLVDWNGYEGSARKVRNEIDVMLMRDLVPVFISCKNGEVHKETLYELDTVARQFGGKYAKKVLLATYISHDAESRKYLLHRAAEMDIRVIGGVDKMTESEFISELKSKTM